MSLEMGQWPVTGPRCADTDPGGELVSEALARRNVGKLVEDDKRSMNARALGIRKMTVYRCFASAAIFTIASANVSPMRSFATFRTRE